MGLVLVRCDAIQILKILIVTELFVSFSIVWRSRKPFQETDVNADKSDTDILGIEGNSLIQYVLFKFRNCKRTSSKVQSDVEIKFMTMEIHSVQYTVNLAFRLRI